MKKTEKIFKNELAKIKSIRKRSGEVVPFDLEIVARAIFKAFEVSGEGGELESHIVANSVFKTLLGLRAELVNKNKGAKFLPTVEIVQDFVEKELMKNGFTDTAKKIYSLSQQAFRTPGGFWTGAGSGQTSSRRIE